MPACETSALVLEGSGMDVIRAGGMNRVFGGVYAKCSIARCPQLRPALPFG